MRRLCDFYARDRARLVEQQSRERNLFRFCQVAIFLSLFVYEKEKIGLHTRRDFFPLFRKFTYTYIIGKSFSADESERFSDLQ